MLVQTQFKVCVGVRSGPKFALGYVLGRRALSLICRSSDKAPGRLGNVG